jgi:uncharacterized protein (TIGR02145 family)
MRHFNFYSQLIKIYFLGMLLLSVSSSASAQQEQNHMINQSVGLMEFKLPDSWKPLEGSALGEAKSEFSSGMTLSQYDRDGEPNSRLDEFQIFQKPADGQVVGWTITIPEQKDFLKKIYDDELKGLDLRKAQIKSGECQLVQIGKSDVVRTDVVLGNSARTTNLHFWSPEQPGLVTVLMVGIRPSHSEQTAKEFDDILSSVKIKNKKQFKTVTIGSQTWMAENLSVSIFRNGEIIPEVKTATAWLAAYKNESPAWCYYKNDPNNGEKYGKLYNWYAVNDPRGLAPEGWHIPTDSEWNKLISACGGQSAAFPKLKEPDGFAALPAGARYFKDASFNHKGNITFWWTASKNDKWNAWYHAMHFGYRQVGRDNGGMNTGHSVRCIKDEQVEIDK